MNNQIPGYSAVYDNRGYSSVCSDCGQSAIQQTQQPQQTLQQQSQMQQQIPSIQQTLPSLQSTVPSQSQQTQNQLTAPITDLTMPMPVTTESMQYMNGFLRTQIGKRVRVQFLIGTNSFLDKMGKLIGVGANYILLQEAMSDDILVCDFFTIKFVSIYK